MSLSFDAGQARKAWPASFQTTLSQEAQAQILSAQIALRFCKARTAQMTLSQFVQFAGPRRCRGYLSGGHCPQAWRAPHIGEHCSV